MFPHNDPDNHPDHSPIIAIFNEPMANVIILAASVGFTGASLDALDDNDVLLDFDDVTGQTFNGIKDEEAENYLLTVSSTTGIRKVRFYQSLWGPPLRDGLVWDNLEFQPIPTRRRWLDRFVPSGDAPVCSPWSADHATVRGCFAGLKGPIRLWNALTTECRSLLSHRAGRSGDSLVQT